MLFLIFRPYLFGADFTVLASYRNETNPEYYGVLINSNAEYQCVMTYPNEFGKLRVLRINSGNNQLDGRLPPNFDPRQYLEMTLCCWADGSDYLSKRCHSFILPETSR